MLGYHEYKALHLISFVFFVVALTKYHAPQRLRRFSSSFLYSSAFVTLSTGIVLMYRFGLNEVIPLWIWLKFLLMFLLVGMIWFPKENSKLSRFRTQTIYFIIFMGIIVSIYKPF